jgi:5-methyltetrahydrofolate--homocysteine methyltransferase
MLIIGERINSTRKAIAEAISANDNAHIQNEARTQTEAGADYIDVNAGAFVGEEEEHLKWLIDLVQEATDLPLCIDSADPTIIQAVLPRVQKPPMINSITLDPASLEGVLPMVSEYGTKVIGLCQTGESMASTFEEKVEMAGRLVEAVKAAGVPLEDLHIDPLTFPLATATRSAKATLDAIETIMREYPGVHTTCGLTNVSFGLPNRKLVNRIFLANAIGSGMDSAILDPTDKQLYASLRAAVMLAGKDNYCREYIQAYREGRLE